MISFCTYFDKNYLSKFLTLKISLDNHKLDYNIFVLALDDYVLNFLKKKNYKNIQIITLEDLELEYADLLVAKKNRTLIEYYFTLSPFLPFYIYQKLNVRQISYLDSDLYFFKNPNNLIKQSSFYSVVLIKQESNPIYGFYNVGWIFFNFDHHETEEIVLNWCAECLNSCNDIPNTKHQLYADQKYLDKWPLRLKKIKILYPEYTCLSPWDKNIVIEKNYQKMISYHFHGLEVYSSYFTTGFCKYNKIISKNIMKKIYKPYILQLISIEKKNNLKGSSIRGASSYSGFKNIIFKIRKFRSKFKQIFYNDYFSIEEIKK